MSTPATEPVSSRPRWPLVTLAVITLLWAGMVLGISCLETPVKFTTPSLERGVGLDVGRTVFNAFNKVEIVWSVLTFTLLLVIRPFRRVPRAIGVLYAIVWPIIIFQSLVLLPALSARAQIVLDGGTLPPAPYHMLYTGSELLKLISLIVLGVLLIRRAAEPEV